MSEMEKRVALAMKEFASQPLANLDSLEPVLVGSLGDAWVHLARAAIGAMREPTDEMCEAGAAYCHDNYQKGRAKQQTTAPDIWQAMIDEALKES